MNFYQNVGVSDALYMARVLSNVSRRSRPVLLQWNRQTLTHDRVCWYQGVGVMSTFGMTQRVIDTQFLLRWQGGTRQ